MKAPGITVAALLFLALTALPTRAQPCRSPACEQVFPAAAGAINVRDYGAVGDGRHDDTRALTAAIAASGADTGREIWHDRIVYLPDGNYRVSAPLQKRYADGLFASGMILVGQSVDRTIIRLADHAPGFGDRTTPLPVVMTSSKRIDVGGGRDYTGRGEGNDAYENFVENLTVDVGSGNPGAVGIDYLANNLGAVRDVVVRAPAGSGAAGIAMLRKWPGPALLQRVSVLGFDTGIDVANTEYGVTLSQVRLAGQHAAGLRNAGNAVAAEDLDIEGSEGPAIVNADPRGLIVLAEGALSARTGAVLDNKGVIVFRGTRVAGAAPAGLAGAARPLRGWLSGAGELHDTASAWTLPHPPAPLVATGPPGAWAHPAPPPEDAAQHEDATGRLQATLRSGAATIYLPHGTYWISDSLEVPAAVHRILGMNSTIRVLPQRRPGFSRETGILRVDGTGAPLAIERLAFDNTDAGKQVAVAVHGARIVVLRDVMGAGVTTLDRAAGGGAVFLEDTCCGLVKIAGGAPVVARQLNTEGSGVRVVNDGSALTVIGLKTEGFCTTVRTQGGGRTEVLGGLVYVVRQPAGADMPAFLSQDAALSASFVEEVLVRGHQYSAYLTDVRGGVRRDTDPESMPQRGLGRIVPLLQTDVTP